MSNIYEPKQFVCQGTGINKKTGANIQFKVPTTISAKGIEKLKDNLLVESFTSGKKIYGASDEETNPLEFCEFVITHLPNTPERSDLLNKIRGELSKRECELHMRTSGLQGDVLSARMFIGIVKKAASQGIFPPGALTDAKKELELAQNKLKKESN